MAACVYHILRRYTLELGIAFDQLWIQEGKF